MKIFRLRKPDCGNLATLESRWKTKETDRLGGSWLGRVPYMIKMQVQVVDQTAHPPKCHSFVGLDRQIGPSPPAYCCKIQSENDRSFTSVQTVHTLSLSLTHTGSELQPQTHGCIPFYLQCEFFLTRPLRLVSFEQVFA